ncbi:carboxypeptidase M32 [Elioraea sp.]|uniref:carboxypeptidase M32 n=1 Tax=Elioraea sp. TaxID=2185103 RepID=UPI0021DDC8DF|nr:carboxypeptidase M32 [Elioraea sp.]GIX10973.1 MAG: carboxypeptidase M32 [Elioraea sp.]
MNDVCCAVHAYDALKARFARIATIEEVAAILHWDTSVTMPAGSAPARGEQMATLAGLAHQLLTAPELAGHLEDAEERAGMLSAADRRNLALMRRKWLRATALPGDLVEATARAASACETAWRTARRESDFAAVAPLLAEVVRLMREQATALSAATGLAPYDALLDGFQPGLTDARLAEIFGPLEAALVRLLPRVLERQAAASEPVPLAGPFPVEAQRGLCRMLAERVGIDFATARLDESTHPFCGGTPTDTRITTRYREDDAAQAILGVLHECGHALYERNLPRDWARQPLGEAAGMAVHESQSLIVEMQACRSDAFLSWLAPRMWAAFGGDPAPYAPANLARLWRRVRPGFIRVEADEVTYPLHVILRWRLERALIAGELAVAELPGAWNEGMRALLGLEVPDDARGCLQDIHWYDGAFGYFPSYTLGAMAAAQLYAAALAAVPGIPSRLAEGDLAPLVGWLREHVHVHGARHGFDDLLRAATGRPLDPAVFVAHLEARYLG